MVQELHSSHIDKRKWDDAVMKNKDYRIYSLSWFLDAATHGDWKALIVGDYESVMPFVMKIKFGIRYCYMPYLVQRYSITGTADQSDYFLSELKRRYPFGQIAVTGELNAKRFNGSLRNNFELALNPNYRLLYASYSNNHKMNIKRYEKKNIALTSSAQLEPLLKIFSEEKANVFKTAELEKILNNIRSIHEASERNGMAKVYQVSVDGELIGGAFFVETRDRIYYLLGTSKKGNKDYQGALYGLLDRVIHEYSERDMVLDFEGSQIESIGYFFKGFGAINRPYSYIKWNNLPFFIKWIKK
ncbi:MAG TPA: GNAT family N-acetyltransferase [Cytophagaceae bacterium]|jgi:hypothetical protein|nr:GNAT family N-acetyltransferase [Cytophagaceae bacterium]